MDEQWKKNYTCFIKWNFHACCCGPVAVRRLVLQLYVVIERKNLLKLVSSESLHAPPATTEAFAISIKVLQQQLAQEIQTKKIVVDGDSKVCINGFVKEAENRPLEIIIMLEDIKSLSSVFDSCSFKWIRKNANDMARTWC